MALEQLQFLEQQIDQLNQELASLLRPHEDQRLAEVPGLGVDSAQQIVADVGATAATFPSKQHLSSWVGACPGDEESAEVKPPPPVAAGQPSDAAGSESSCQCADQTQRKHLPDSLWPLCAASGTQSNHRNNCPQTLPLGLEDLAPRNPYEERGPEVSKASKQERIRKMIRQLRRLGYRIEPSPSQSAITA